MYLVRVENLFGVEGGEFVFPGDVSGVNVVNDPSDLQGLRSVHREDIRMSFSAQHQSQKQFTWKELDWAQTQDQSQKQLTWKELDWAQTQHQSQK